MTSNMGSNLIMDSFGDAASAGKVSGELIEKTRDQVMEMMTQVLKPEFLNRIDEIVMFTPLTREDVQRIVDIQINIIAGMLAGNGISLDVSPEAKAWIAEEGYDPMFGARPVKRTIQRYIVNDLSKQILAGTVNRDKPITIDADKAGLVFGN